MYNTEKLHSRQLLNYSNIILPLLSENWKNVQNTILSSKLSFNIQLGEKTWQWKATANGLNFVQPSQWCCMLSLSIAGYSCHCFLDDIAPLALYPLDQDDLSIMPKELLDVVFQSTTHLALQMLSKSIGYTCELLDFTYSPLKQHNKELEYHVSASGLSFILLSQNDSSLVHGYIVSELPNPLMNFLVSKAHESLSVQSILSEEIGKICLNVNVKYTFLNLPIEELENLDLGDCLLLPVHDHEIKVHLCLSPYNYIEAKYNLQTKQLSVVDFMQDNLTSNSVDDENANSEDSASITNNLTINSKDCVIPVHCQLGSVSLSLDTISNLCQGMVLGPLGGIDEPVSIYIGNTLIGQGALIDIEGRVGVQLTKVLLNNG